MEKYNVDRVRFCEGCNVDLCETCTFSALRHSRYGGLLEQMRPRFASWAFEDEQRFIKLIGEDVDPLRHGLHQANTVALPFIKAQNESPWHQSFTPSEAKTLYIGNILHDAHEGITGDVPLPDKDLNSNQEEQAVNLSVVRDILGLSATADFMQAYESIIWDLEGWSHAGRAFKAIEVIGYVETGLLAWAAKDHSDLGSDEQAKVAGMGHVVLSLDTPLLAPFCKDFIYAAQVHARAMSELRVMKNSAPLPNNAE